MRLLPRARPDIDVPMRKMLALPAKRPLLMGQRFGNEIDRFPKALNIAHRVGVVRRHLTAPRLDKADLQAPPRNDIRRGVFLRNPHRLLPQGNQCPQAQNASFASLAGQNTKEHGIGPEQGVDARVMLNGDDVEPLVIAEQEFVQAFLEQIGRDLRITVLVRQASTDGIRAVEHFLRHVGIGDLVMIPNVHGLFLDSIAASAGIKQQTLQLELGALSQSYDGGAECVQFRVAYLR